MNHPTHSPSLIPPAKSAIESRTIWVNLAAPILSTVLQALGLSIPPEAQMAILGVVNVLLRKITDRPIDRWL